MQPQLAGAMGYHITFPISTNEFWVAFRGRLQPNNLSVLIMRWLKSDALLQKNVKLLQKLNRIQDLNSNNRTMTEAAEEYLPHINNINLSSTTLDFVITNCSEWTLVNSQSQTFDSNTALNYLLQIHYGYNIYYREEIKDTNIAERDFHIENIIKNNDSIVLLDFGLMKSQFKIFKGTSKSGANMTVLMKLYSIYWHPSIFQPTYKTNYTWSLGVILIQFLLGRQYTKLLEDVVISQMKSKIKLNLKSFLSELPGRLPTKMTKLISDLLEGNIIWEKIQYQPPFTESPKCLQTMLRLNPKKKHIDHSENYFVPPTVGLIKLESEPYLRRDTKNDRKQSQYTPERNIITESKFQPINQINRNGANNGSNHSQGHQPKFVQDINQFRVEIGSNQVLRFKKNSIYFENNNNQSIFTSQIPPKEICTNNKGFPQNSQDENGRRDHLQQRNLIFLRNDSFYQSHQDKIRNSILLRSTHTQSPPQNNPVNRLSNLENIRNKQKQIIRPQIQVSIPTQISCSKISPIANRKPAVTSTQSKQKKSFRLVNQYTTDIENETEKVNSFGKFKKRPSTSRLQIQMDSEKQYPQERQQIESNNQSDQSQPTINLKTTNLAINGYSSIEVLHVNESQLLEEPFCKQLMNPQMETSNPSEKEPNLSKSILPDKQILTTISGTEQEKLLNQNSYGLTKLQSQNYDSSKEIKHQPKPRQLPYIPKTHQNTPNKKITTTTKERPGDEHQPEQTPNILSRPPSVKNLQIDLSKQPGFMQRQASYKNNQKEQFNQLQLGQDKEVKSHLKQPQIEVKSQVQKFLQENDKIFQLNENKLPSTTQASHLRKNSIDDYLNGTKEVIQQEGIHKEKVKVIKDNKEQQVESQTQKFSQHVLIVQEQEDICNQNQKDKDERQVQLTKVGKSPSHTQESKKESSPKSSKLKLSKEYDNSEEFDSLEIYQVQSPELRSMVSQESPPVSPTKRGILKNNSGNYIQLIRKDDENIKIFEDEYKMAFECINLIGTSVVKCLDYLNGLQNFWVIPLFLIFKRMLQIRCEAERQLENKTNLLDLDEWQNIVQSTNYDNFQKKVSDENGIVEREMHQLLNQARKKAEKLEKSRRAKIEWFLNDDLEQDIQSTVFVYFYSQIYQNIQGQIKQNTSPKISTVEWIKLAIQVQASIIISELPTLNYPVYQIDYKQLQQTLQITNEEALRQYLGFNEQILDALKEKLKKKGYKI